MCSSAVFLVLSTMILCSTARPIPSEEVQVDSASVLQLLDAYTISGILILFSCILLVFNIISKLVRTFFPSPSRPSTPSLQKYTSFNVLPPPVPKSLPPILLSNVLIDETLECPFTLIPPATPVPIYPFNVYFNRAFDENAAAANCSTFYGKVNMAFSGEETFTQVPKKLFTSYKEMF